MRTQVLALFPQDISKLSAQCYGSYSVIEKEMLEKRKKKRQFFVNMLKQWVTPAHILTGMTVQEVDKDAEQLPVCTLDQTEVDRW